MGNVIEQFLNLKMHYMAQTGAEPTRLTVGRDVADRLADEMLEIEMAAMWSPRISLPTRKAELLRQMASGDVSLWGVKIEAGWLNG